MDSALLNKMPSALLLGQVGAAIGGGDSGSSPVEPPPLDGISGLTAAFSVSRQLLTAYGGSFYSATGSEITSLLDQSGNSRDANKTTGTGPTLSTVNGRACADFDGSTMFLSTQTAVLSSFIANTAAYVVCSFMADALASNQATIYNNNGLWADSGAFMGVYLKTGGTASAFNWDGNADVAASAITTSLPYAVELKHESGNIMVRINSGSWTSAVSGNTQNLTNPIFLGRGYTSGALPFFNGKMFELAFFNSIPSVANQDSIAASFQGWIS